MLSQPARRAYIAVGIARAPFPNPKCVNHAVAEEGMIIRAWIELRVRAVAVQRAAQTLRNLAADFGFQGQFDTDWCLIAAEIGIGGPLFGDSCVHGSPSHYNL